MDIFNMTADELVVISAIVSKDIAKDLTSDETQVVRLFFNAIASNLFLYAEAKQLLEDKQKNKEKC